MPRQRVVKRAPGFYTGIFPYSEDAMRIMVVGAGATGGYFGGRLAEAGRDVSFLVRPGRAAQLRAEGLQIVSPHGNATLRPGIVTADRLDGTYDLVLVTVKAFALDAAIADFAPAVGGATMILPVLNGMRHLDALAARFGDGAVLGGVCIVATTLDAQNRVVQLAEMQELIYGERDGRTSARVAALDAAMQGAGFQARASGAILQEMWQKWVFLATLGAITGLMRGTIGEIVAIPGGADHATKLLDECAAIATASGHPPSEAFLARIRANVTAAGSGLASSMYRDLQQGNPVEVEHILVDLLARATALGVSAPVLAAACVHLGVYQARVIAVRATEKAAA